MKMSRKKLHHNNWSRRLLPSIDIVDLFGNVTLVTFFNMTKKRSFNLCVTNNTLLYGFTLLKTSLCMWYWGNMSSRLSSNFKANASELLENLEKCFLVAGIIVMYKCKYCLNNKILHWIASEFQESFQWRFLDTGFNQWVINKWQ